MTGNIGGKAAATKMKEQIEARLGRVDILVNCAGGDIGAAGGKPVPNDALGIPLEDIKALTENNLYGTIFVCQAFVPPMAKAGGGSVIKIGSAAAQFGVTDGVIHAALKAAVIHYTRCLAAAVRAEGVRVNGVSPGATKTARFEATRRAERDGRRGCLPCRAEEQVHQRAGPPGRRRRDTVSGMRIGFSQHWEG